MLFYEKVIKAFQKAKVKYILVGGVAFNLLGGHRGTADMDILVEMTDENLARVVRVMKKLGFSVKQPVDPMGIADKKTRIDWIENKNMKAFNFYKEDLQEVDIIIDTPVSYEDAMKDVIIKEVDGVRLPVISFRKLIKMKEKAGRTQDKSDVLELKRLMDWEKRKVS
jgi:predicted nucleotidyltransferase